MDSLTQIALGIAVAEVVAGKVLKNRTFLYGAVLGTLPDLDVLAGRFLSPVDAAAIHRGISHSILLFAVGTPLLAYGITQWEKQRIGFKQAAVMVFLCLFTHSLLDVFTTWGTQVFWPLPERLAWKTIFVIDPLYTLPLLVALFFVWKNKATAQRRFWVKRGLWWSSCYLLLTVGLKLYSLHQFEKALQAQGLDYSELIVKPTPLNTILWQANVKTVGGDYLLADYSLLDSQPITFTTYRTHPELEQQLAQVADFKKLQVISEGWYLVTEKNGRLYYNDLRFGLLDTNPDNPVFVFSYEFVPSKNGLQAVEVVKEKRDGKKLIYKILKRIKGN